MVPLIFVVNWLRVELCGIKYRARFGEEVANLVSDSLYYTQLDFIIFF
jgi:hypothetical protein